LHAQPPVPFDDLAQAGAAQCLAQLSQLMRLRWVFEGCWGEKRESFQGLPIGNRV
jgi:hypothetical protein